MYTGHARNDELVALWLVPETRVSEVEYTVTIHSSIVHSPAARHGASRRRHDKAYSLIRLSGRWTRSFPGWWTSYTSCVGGDQDVRVEEGSECCDLGVADI